MGGERITGRGAAKRNPEHASYLLAFAPAAGYSQQGIVKVAFTMWTRHRVY